MQQQRARCQYGEKCFRRNANHKAQFCHPGDSDWDPPAAVLAAGATATAEIANGETTGDETMTTTPSTGSTPSSPSKSSSGFVYSLLPAPPRKTKKIDREPSTISAKKKAEIDALIKEVVENDYSGRSKDAVAKRLARIMCELVRSDDHYRVLAKNKNSKFISEYLLQLCPYSTDDDDDGLECEEDYDEEDYDEDDSEWECTTEDDLSNPWSLSLLRVPASSYVSLSAVNRMTYSLLTSSAFFQAKRLAGWWRQEILVAFADDGIAETPSTACLSVSRDGDSWSYRPLASLPQAVSWGCAPPLMINGQLYLVCGNEMGRASTSVLAYNASDDVWNPAPPIPETRHFAACGVVKRSLIVAGGQLTATGVTDTVVEFDVSRREWRTLPKMLYAVSSAQSGVIQDRMYIAGGFAEAVPEDRLLMFDHRSSVWKRKPSMKEVRSKGAGVVFLGKLIVVGGYSGDHSPTSSLFIYNPASEKWLEGPEMPQACANCMAVAIGSSILVLRSPEFMSKNYTPMILDVSRGCWSKLSKLLPDAAPIAALAVYQRH